MLIEQGGDLLLHGCKHLCTWLFFEINSQQLLLTSQHTHF
jgi:hypothetical protein